MPNMERWNGEMMSKIVMPLSQMDEEKKYFRASKIFVQGIVCFEKNLLYGR
jgi:hypothetical protein